MSYIDGNTGNGRKALTGGTAALIQAGLALALINGLAVHFIRSDPPPRTEGAQIPLSPPPLPVETPKVEPKTPVIRDTFIDRVQPKIPPSAQTEITPQPKVEPAGGNDRIIDILPPFIPPRDPPRFTPQGAKPRGDVARWVTTDDYPPSDIRAGHTGTVQFRVAIDAEGEVTGCTVLSSSGYPGLDAATCRNVSKRARFNPATDAEGAKVAGSYTGTIRWVIPRD